MNMLARAGVGLSALLACLALAPAVAQSSPIVTAPGNNGQTVPSQAIGYGSLGSSYTPVDPTHPLPVLPAAGGATNVQGQVVSGDQAYTAGAYQPLNLTLTGRLKVGLSSAVTSASPAASISDLMGGVDPLGNQYGVLLDALKRLLVDDPNNASYTIGDSATTATGTFSAGGTSAPTRGVSISCAAGTTETVTLTNAAGRTWPDYASGPKNYDGVNATSWSGNSAGCTVTAFY